MSDGSNSHFDVARALQQAAGDAPGADWRDGLLSDDLGDGVRLNRFQFRTMEPHRMVTEGPSAFSLAVFIDGRASLTIENGAAIAIRPETTVIFHAPHFVRGEYLIEANSRIRCVDIRFAPSLRDEFGGPALSALIRSFPAHGSVGKALLLARPTPPVLSTIVSTVLDCRLPEPSRRLFRRAKALEALAFVAALVDDSDEAPATLGRRDRERIEEAARLLAARHCEAWTIAALARTVGINERKLKAGFRTVLGKTVHQHLEDSRLNAATHLLRDDGVSITEAALAVGYANPSHFATIFRRRHGLPPRAWREREQVGVGK